MGVGVGVHHHPKLRGYRRRQSVVAGLLHSSATTTMNFSEVLTARKVTFLAPCSGKGGTEAREGLDSLQTGARAGLGEPESPGGSAPHCAARPGKAAETALSTTSGSLVACKGSSGVGCCLQANKCGLTRAVHRGIVEIGAISIISTYEVSVSDKKFFCHLSKLSSKW